MPVPLGHMPGGSMGAGMQLALTTHQTGGMSIAKPTMSRIHKQRHLHMVLEMEEQHPADMLHLLQILLRQVMVKLMQPAQLLQMVQMGMVAQLMFLQLVVGDGGLAVPEPKRAPRKDKGKTDSQDRFPEDEKILNKLDAVSSWKKSAVLGGGGWNWGWLVLPKGSNQTRRSSVPNALLLDDFVCVFQARTNCIWALSRAQTCLK